MGLFSCPACGAWKWRQAHGVAVCVPAVAVTLCAVLFDAWVGAEMPAAALVSANGTLRVLDAEPIAAADVRASLQRVSATYDLPIDWSFLMTK